MKKASMNTTESEQRDTPVDATESVSGAETDDHASPATEAHTDDLNRGLMLRVGIAVALIVALLGGLAVLDDMNTPVKKSGTNTVASVASTQPAPATSTTTGTESSSSPDASSVQVPPLNAESETPPPERSAAAEESSEAPTVPAPAPENIPATPPAQRPLTRPATPHLAMMHPSDTAANRLPPPSTAASTALARTQTPQVLSAPTHAPASRPLSQSSSQSPLTPTPRAATSGGMLLQLGVFTSTAHAEELRAKLELNGIPAQIESRVQVGPFATREEAEQMREKLKKLGLEGGVLVATKK